jgi:hypothetical protein
MSAAALHLRGPAGPAGVPRAPGRPSAIARPAGQAASGDAAATFTAPGDARELAEPDGPQDAVLLFGPLYHLTVAADRQRALHEA